MSEERRAHGAVLRVNPLGGYIEQYRVDGRDILFYAMIDGKKRGTHVCVPNFGPDASGRLAQHGFGRSVMWQVEQSDDASVVLRYHHKEDDAWQGLTTTLSYQLFEAGLRMTLQCYNESQTPLRVAPGFHPYFMCHETDTPVSVAGEVYTAAELHATQYRAFGEHPVAVGVDDQVLTLRSQGLPMYAIWSAQTNRYICVEPTAGGNRFLTDAGDGEWVAPGERRLYQCEVTLGDAK